jgi:hypothetical protein
MRAEIRLEASFIPRRDEPPPSRLMDCLPNEVGRDAGLDAISESPERSRNGHGREARTVGVADVSEMEHQAHWNAKPPPMPARRHRHVNFPGKHVREVVKRKRRLMGEHSGLLTPEPEHDEVLMVAGRKVDETVHPTTGSHHPPACQVLV